jgi:plasmid stability protein
MVTFTLKGIPPELYKRLKARAAEHRRSINSEMIVCIEEALGVRRADPAAVLAEARRLRSLYKGPPLTNDKIDAAKRWGRP